MALAWALASACAHAPQPAASGASIAEGDRPALFERKCGLCHPAGWVSYSAQTRDDWALLVERMRRLRRGWISDEEAAAIVDYRSTRYVSK